MVGKLCCIMLKYNIGTWTICRSNRNNHLNLLYVCYILATCALSFSNVWTSCFTLVHFGPLQWGKKKCWFQKSAKTSKDGNSISYSLLVCSCLLSSVSFCHRGQHQLHAAFESGPLKRQLFQKEENITRGICKWGETGKLRAYKLLHDHHMAMRCCHLKMCVCASLKW